MATDHWYCEQCHSANQPNVARCYSCGQTRRAPAITRVVSTGGTGAMANPPACPRCLTALATNVRFCGTCGLDVVTGAVPQVQNAPPGDPSPQPRTAGASQQPQSPSTATKPVKAKSTSGGSLGALALGAVMLLIAFGAFGNRNDTGSGSGGGGSNTVRATPRPVAQHAAVDRTLMSARGSGIKNTREFAVTDTPWTLDYSYDCSAFGFRGNFIVSIYEGQDLVDLPVNALGKRGRDSSEVYDAGDLHLEINSECDWSVTATGR